MGTQGRAEILRVSPRPSLRVSASPCPRVVFNSGSPPERVYRKGDEQHRRGIGLGKSRVPEEQVAGQQTRGGDGKNRSQGLILPNINRLAGALFVPAAHADRSASLALLAIGQR